MKLERKYYGFQLFFNLLVWIPIFYEFQKISGLNDQQIFNIQSIYYLAFILFEVPTGFVADQFGKKKALVIGAGILAFSNLIPVLSVTYSLFLLHFILIAMARSLISGSASALLYDHLKEKGESSSYKKIEGKARSLALIARLLTWPIAGFALKQMPELPYIITFAFCLMALSFSLTLPKDRKLEKVTKEKAKADIVDSVLYIFKGDNVLRFMLQGAGLFILQRVCMLQLFQPLLKAKDVDVQSFGIVMSLMTVAEAFAASKSANFSKILPKRLKDDKTSLPILTIALATVFIFLGRLDGYFSIAGLVIFSGFCGLIFPLQKQLLNDSIVDDGKRATILSLESIIHRGLASIFTFAIGYFITRYSLPPLFQWTGIAIIGIVLLTLINTKAKMTVKIVSLFLILNVSILAKHEIQKTNVIRPWIFFDLGNTIVDTTSKKKIHYYPNTVKYLKNLKEQGYRIGVISNIPEKFGKTYDEKLATLKGYINKKWDDKVPFDWTVFDEIILPLNDGERKPAPILFKRAIARAGRCPIVFMGENNKEIEAAKNLGLSTFQVGEKDKSFYLPQKGLVQHVQKTFQREFKDNCLPPL